MFRASSHTTLPSLSPIQQIDGLQILRAVAVVLVAWTHAGQSLLSFNPSPLPTLGIFGVDIFFVISGFIMGAILNRANQRTGPQAGWLFLKRRLIRIFPIYWLVALLVAGRLWHSKKLFEYNYWSSVFLLPSFTYPRSVYLVPFSWTMTFEVSFYFALSIILVCFTRYIVWSAVFSFCLAVGIGQLSGIKHPVVVIICSPMLLEFVLGLLISLAHESLGKVRKLGITILLLGATASIILMILPHFGAQSQQEIVVGIGVTKRALTWGVAAAMIVCGVVLWSPVIASRTGKVAVTLGNSSYSAYLLSAYTIEYGGSALLRFLGRSAVPTILITLTIQGAVVGVVLVVGWVCYQFVEWPLVRSLQARFAGRVRA